jgi:hypothetical protein
MEKLRPKKAIQLSFVVPMLASIAQRAVANSTASSGSSLALMIPGILFVICLIVGTTCGVYSLVTWRKGDQKRIIFGGVAGTLFSGGQLVLIIVVAVAAFIATTP